jgi:hypothetical protein
VRHLMMRVSADVSGIGARYEQDDNTEVVGCDS